MITMDNRFIILVSFAFVFGRTAHKRLPFIFCLLYRQARSFLIILVFLKKVNQLSVVSCQISDFGFRISDFWAIYRSELRSLRWVTYLGLKPLKSEIWNLESPLSDRISDFGVCVVPPPAACGVVGCRLSVVSCQLSVVGFWGI
jgi:hypothetical protein